MNRSSLVPSLSPRLSVLGLLMASFAWALVIPLSLTSPPSPALALIYILGIALLGLTLMLVLAAVVNPALPIGRRRGRVLLLAGATLALWVPTYSWAQPNQQPWAWLAGFVIAASALASWQMGLVVAAILGAGTAGGTVAFGGSSAAQLLIMFGCALCLWLMCQAMVGLLRLLWAAQAGKEAETQLALARQRLRTSRELHDVLGHRLSLIALKAELAADLVAQNPQGSAQHSAQIRELATQALAEARQAVHGDTVADLPAQLRAAELVLTSAGIHVEIEAEGASVAGLEQTLSHLLAAVVREAVTNVLLHSDARQVSIALTESATHLVFLVSNDGARPSPGVFGTTSSGTGLASLAARCRAHNARLISGHNRVGQFQLRVEYRIPSRSLQ